MSDGQPQGDPGLQGQVDDLRERTARNRADIDSLLSRADASALRADHSEARADKADVRADEADARADRSEARSDADRLRIDDLEERAQVDRAMIAELQADGLVSQAHVADLEMALRTSRMIGAALGIVMAKRSVSEVEAFTMLSRASQNANRKLRIVADDIVTTGDVSRLPGT